MSFTWVLLCFGGWKVEKPSPDLRLRRLAIINGQAKVVSVRGTGNLSVCFCGVNNFSYSPQLDLTKPIEDQGPLDVIIHKLTDIILEADQNDSQSLELVHRFQEYIDAHPETIILDPLPAIRTLLDRSKSYELIRQIEAYMQGFHYFGLSSLSQHSLRVCPLGLSLVAWEKRLILTCLQPPFTSYNLQLPPLLLTRPVLQRLHQLHCPSLDTLQHLSVFLAVDTGFKCSSFTGKGFDRTEMQNSKLLEAAERGGSTMEACVNWEQHADDEWEQQCVVSSGKVDYQEAVTMERAVNDAAENLNPSSPFESFFCLADERICSPPFMELTSACGEDTLQLIEKNGLAFPFICKTRVAHGTNSHEMAIIFNQEGLKAVRPPCVIQSFINHNAVLYKVFVVGESYTVVKRPSLKNFSAGISDRESIFFNSHNVSKPESSSILTAAEVCLVPRTSMTVYPSGFPYRAPLDKIEGVFERPNDDVIREISKALRQALGVSLFGIDIIINNQTGQHAVIDINAFPGYEGVSEFFTDLLNHIAAVLQGQVPEVTQLNRSKLLAEQTGGIMDERICCASTGCLSVMGKDSSWIVESETNSSVKLQHQRLGCNSAVSPSFQQHCVATLATKASSQ
ncbi:hypothetical protein BTVI_93333 [Pitangus sulphuratus]|nr:hypothetical protein BTVI_93333 [Pitangus sulphuratus]